MGTQSNDSQLVSSLTFNWGSFLLLILVAVLGTSSSAQHVGSQEAKATGQDTLDRIERECSNAYPSSMLASPIEGRTSSDDHESPSHEDRPRSMRERFLEKGLFYPSLLDEIYPALDRYLRPGLRFLDLGSGDGRVLFLANVLGVHATGIEQDSMLARISRQASVALKDLVDSERVRIIENDFFEENWSSYDVVYYYDSGSFEGHRVREKLNRELRDEAILLVNYEQASFPGLDVVEVIRPITVYRRPAGKRFGEK